MCSPSHSQCGRGLDLRDFGKLMWQLPHPWKKCLEIGGCWAQNRATWNVNELGICGNINGSEEQLN